jgi:hypothetical protein
MLSLIISDIMINNNISTFFFFFTDGQKCGTIAEIWKVLLQNFFSPLSNTMNISMAELQARK